MLLSDSIYEPAGAAQHLSCPPCLVDIQICRPAHDFPTTYAALVDMFSNDCSTMVDRNSKTLRRETSNSFKRSVPSMKSLLPLKLVSTTLPQSDIWLSTSQDQRSTFGAILPTKESSEVKGKTNNPFGLRLSHLPSRQPQRDTPIYNEPGSPLPGRAYYTSDDLCINCSSPGLSCVDGCVFNYRRSTDIQARENEFENEFASQSNTVYATDIHRRSNVSDAPRSSGMSFQCTGEVMVPSEAAWLSTPLPNSPKSKLVRRRSTLNQPLEMSVESWLSDTAAELGENVLACATAVSPSKAQVVEINTYRLSEEGLPPRVSSLNAPCSANLPVGRYSWTPSDDSPPDTPTDEWEFDDRRSPRKEPQWIFPSRPYDLAMNSPPISPKVIPDPPAASRFSYLVMSVGIEIGADPNMTSRWSLDSTTSEEKSNIDIMTDLEDIVSGFPTNMLLPDTPCISEIRLGLGNANPERSSHDTSYLTHEPRTYFTNLNDRKSIANFSRPRRTDNLSSSRSTPMVQPTAWRSSYISSSSTIQPATRLPTPDLAPLSRIFPNGSEYAHLGLYAHMIAYIFLTSLPTPSPQLENLPRRRRRDTPYWTPAQGGQPHMSISYSQANESSLKSRSLDLKTKLRKCIFRLMNNMDSSICQDNGDGRAELMLRAVEEVVRASEKLSSTATH